MRFVLVLRSTFDLQQEPMRFVLTCQAGLFEFLFADQCLQYMNKEPKLNL